MKFIFFRLTELVTRHALLVACLWLLAPNRSSALIDLNHNGVSDVWERRYNDGDLLSSFIPTADSDGDGWTDEVEAISGTDPFDGSSPSGFVRPEITHIPAVYVTGLTGESEILTPEAITITWPTLTGKLYTILTSIDLTSESWIPIGDPEVSVGDDMEIAIELTQADGSSSPEMFWKVAINDTDYDSDQLTDAEENELGTNPYSQYSDGDFLSDTLETFYYFTDPGVADSDGDGTPDHDESPLIAVNGAGQNRYAPSIRWVAVTRNAYYDYAEDFATPPKVLISRITTSASYNFDLGGITNYSGRYPIGSVSATLPAFPGPAELPGGTRFLGGHLTNSCSVFANSESVWLNQMQVRIHASTPPETEIVKRLMVVTYNEFGTVTSVDANTFTIPAAKYASLPQVIDDGFQTVGGSEVRMELRSFEFKANPAGNPAWDDTGSEYWLAAGVGEVIKGTLSVGFGELPPALADRLEIVPAPGSEQYIAVSDVAWWVHGCHFKITGIKASPAVPQPSDPPNLTVGAQIVVRLKADHTKILSTLRVHVMTPREVPVTLFRVWDSRQPASQDTGGVNFTELIATLNETYKHQGKLHFTYDPSTSGIVDIKHIPGNLFNEPPLFNARGNIDAGSLLTVNDTVNQIKRRGELNKRLTIYLVHGFSENADNSPVGVGSISDIGGVGRDDINAVMLPRAAAQQPQKDEIYAHELGHALSLAFKAVGARHDLGPWPQAWASDKRVGLMHPSAIPEMVPWLRQQDWSYANTDAGNLR